MTEQHSDQQREPGTDVVRTTEKETVRERLVQRDCAWCGKPIPYAGTGRPRKFCSDAHKTRHWELRTVLERLEADAAAGLVRTDAVREVVEKVVTVERTVTLQPRVEYARPARASSARDWTALVQPLLADAMRRPMTWAADPDTGLLAATLADVLRALAPSTPRHLDPDEEAMDAAAEADPEVAAARWQADLQRQDLAAAELLRLDPRDVAERADGDLVEQLLTTARLFGEWGAQLAAATAKPTAAGLPRHERRRRERAERKRRS